MNWSEIAISVVAAIGLFTHSLQGFTDNLRNQADGKIKYALSKISDSKIKGVLLGFTATALIQSSSAVAAILVSFVDSGVVSFVNTLPILLGSNIGTTVTAWLVSMKIGSLGIIMLALGFVLGYFRGKLSVLAKPIFYLGLILFSLELIGEHLIPIKENPKILEYLSYASSPIIGVVIGALVTALCQSSSVTIGLAIILSDQGVLELDGAISIIVGSNIGTTTTAFLAAIHLGKGAKMTAIANLLFNLLGVLLYLPFAGFYAQIIAQTSEIVTYQVAYAHLIFNILIALLVLPVTGTIAKYLEKKWKFESQNF